MQAREKKLAIIAVSFVAVTAGYLLVERTVVGRFRDLNGQKTALDATVEKLGDEQIAIVSAERRIADWTSRSFPPDAVAAQRMYLAWLTDLAQSAGFSSPKLTPDRRVAPNKVYVSFRVTIEASATFPQLCGFLFQFRRTDLLHRIADLTVDGADGSATSPLKLTIVAEGISLKGAAPRTSLFPKTELAAAIEPSSDKVSVNKAEGFPTKGEFLVRSGGELLKVQDVSDSTWKVVRGVDGTTAIAHKLGDPMELVPLLPGWKDRKIEDFRALTSQNPFAKPGKPKPPESPNKSEQKPTVALDDPAAKTTKFVGSTIVNESRQVCFLDPASDKRTYVKEGDSFAVAGIKGKLVTINSNHILVQIEKDKWRLDLGKELAAMKKLDAAGNPIPTPATPPSAAPSTASTTPAGAQPKPAATAPGSDPANGKPATTAPPEKSDEKKPEGSAAPAAGASPSDAPVAVEAAPAASIAPSESAPDAK